MPLPKENETKDEYLQRCISYLIKEEGKPQKQAVAICYNYWDRSKDIEESNLSYIEAFENEESHTELVEDKNIRVLKEQSEQDHVNKKINLSNLLTSDRPSIGNKISGWKPRGIIITDTYNNPFFPVQHPRIDTTKFFLPEIKRQLKTYYASGPLTYTPWHFHIEILGNAEYFIFNTRPLDSKFPLSTNESLKIIKSNNIKLNPITERFFKNKPFEIEDSIHINIVGDSSFDVYTYDLYQIIGRTCIGPILRYFKLPRKMYQKVYPLQMGDRFNADILDQFLQR
jgi:hypothetical protein